MSCAHETATLSNISEYFPYSAAALPVSLGNKSSVFFQDYNRKRIGFLSLRIASIRIGLPKLKK
jgi:hypothetical protein